MATGAQPIAAMRVAAAPVPTPEQTTNVYTPASANIVAAVIQTGAHNLFGFTALNQVAAVTWLCFYDKATTPVVGTDVPVFAVPIPAGAGTGLLPLTIPMFALKAFVNGIAVAAGTGPTGVAAPATAPQGSIWWL